LHNVVYVVRYESSIIRMFTADTLSPLGDGIHVKEMKNPKDIVACRHGRQLYVADWFGACIWRVSADDHSYVKWLPTEATTDICRPLSLSLVSSHLLVMSQWPCTLRQYSTTDGQLLCDVKLPGYMNLYHAVETTRQTFIVGHHGTPQNKLQYVVSKLCVFCHVLLISATFLLTVRNLLSFSATSVCY